MMKRVAIGTLVSAILVGGVVVMTMDAEAQRRGRRGRQARQAPPPPAPTEPPHSDNIGELLEELEWGMSKDQVLRYFRDKIRADYRPRLAKAPGPSRRTASATR